MKKRIFSFLLAAVLAFSVLVLVACGECEHKFDGGTCTECGEADPNYVPPCNHTFKNGACTQCGEPCVHSFSDGVCTVCGAIDVDYVPEDGGRSLYEDIVDDFVDLIIYKKINEELPPKPSNAPFYTDVIYEVGKLYDPSIEVGYAYKDINGDGWCELFLMGRESRIYAFFTITERVPAIVHVFQNGMGYLTPDGTVFYNTNTTDSETGAITSEKFISRMQDGKLVSISYGWTDTDGDIATDADTVYHTTGEDGAKSETTYDEYKQYGKIYEHFWSYSTRLTKLAGLKFEPALPTTAVTDITADFSSYDAIITTFGKMHSDVAQGKFERSHWIAGRYDFGMTFNTDEDYHTYNALLGACVLTQNSSTAKFGYAKKDLNGDGVEELILLESKYHVLAVFTEMDGTPVLLDSFNDLRTAFIDASGKIHVKQKTVPGNENDADYFVYEVKGGELVSTLAVAERCDASGTPESFYKIEGEQYTEISREQFDILYADFILDVETSTYNSYTKNNAGLTFIQVSPAV